MTHMAIMSVIHARIRNNCNNLSYDLYYNHLIPNPLCSCNLEIEDTGYFLFPKYANERTILFRETHNYHSLNLNMVLFGDINATPESNSTIFKAVQIYIKNTKRFSDS